MKFQRSFAGIALIIVAIVIVFVGYRFYMTSTTTTTQNVVGSTLSDDVIANLFSCAEDKSDSEGVKMTKGEKGSYGCETSLITQYITSITRGDINNDGYEDALVVEGHCGASCGNSIYIVLNQKNGIGKLIGVSIDKHISSGASQTSIKNITINDGIVAITANGFKDSSNWDTLVTKEFRFDGSNLIEVKS